MISGDKVLLGSSGCPGTLCEPGWPQTHRNVPASASRVPRLKGVALGAAWGVSYLSCTVCRTPCDTLDLACLSNMLPQESFVLISK